MIIIEIWYYWLKAENGHTDQLLMTPPVSPRAGLDGPDHRWPGDCARCRCLCEISDLGSGGLRLVKANLVQLEGDRSLDVQNIWVRAQLL